MIFVKAQDSVTGIYYSLVCFIMIYDFKIDFRDTSDATRHHIDIKGSNISGQNLKVEVEKCSGLQLPEF